MSIEITDTYLQPNGPILTGNRPLFLILFDSKKTKHSIYDMDTEDKYTNGKSMFRGHFFVTKEGRIFKGREANVYGEFAFDSIKNISFDTNSLGICAEGNYSVELMSTAQKNSISLLIKHLMTQYPEIKNIYGLNELVSGKDILGNLFPLNEIVSISLSDPIEAKRVAPNGTVHYAFASRTLTYNARKPLNGNDIIELQFILNLLGYKCNNSGIFDIDTLNSIISLQRSSNLIPDGVVSEKTYELIQKLSKRFYESSTLFNRILKPTQPNFMYGKDVEMLQSKLNLLGYDCIQNGFYDDQTREAVINFQNTFMIKPDGKVGPITWTQITANDYNFIKRILKYSLPMMYGDDIRLIQQRLIDKGFNISTALGWFDEITRQQVINFQKSAGMEATGIIDELTAKELFD